MDNDFTQEREDLAAAFRWTVRLNMHEAVANHFSWQLMRVAQSFF